MDQKNHVAVISGASSGLELEFVRQLAATGQSLVLVARGHERLERIAAEVAEQYTVRVHVIVADLQDPSSVQTIHEEIDSWGFTVDTLINNAGFSSFGDFPDSSIEWETGQIDVDVRALVALTKGFLPELLIAFNMCSCSVFDTSGYLLWQLSDSSL